MSVINELRELDAFLEGREDIDNEGGPNTAMRVRQVLAVAIPQLAELTEAAQRVLDKEWEYGNDQPHCVRLNDAITSVQGGAA